MTKIMTSSLDSASSALYTSQNVTQHAQGLSLRNFLASLTTSATVFAIEVCLFVLLKDRLQNIYYPRAFLLPERIYKRKGPSGIASWIPQVIQIPDRFVLQYSGLDAFFFIRYLGTLCKVFTFMLITVVPVLIPLNALGGNDAAGGVRGLDKFSWANIGITKSGFCWAHMVMSLAVILFVCHTIYKELAFYVHVRSLYLTSPGHRLLDSANTLLVTDIPRKALMALADLYSLFPGGVHSVWINRDLTPLQNKIQEQKMLVVKAEAAATRLIRSAVETSSLRKRCRPGDMSTKDERSAWRYFLDDKNSELMHLRKEGRFCLPCIRYFGNRAHSIDLYLERIGQLDREIKQGQTELAKLDRKVGGAPKDLTEFEVGPLEQGKYKQTTSAFIQFNTQQAAYMAYQTTLGSNPLCFLAHQVSVSTKEVRWSNLSLPWWNRWIRTGLIFLIIGLLLILWAVPVAFTGFLSQITTLTGSLTWLSWINDLPEWLCGVIQGVLPQLALTLLTILLPYILQFLVGWQGSLTETEVELSLQKYYFVFLFVQNFLTVSLSSSITAIAQDVLHKPDSTPALLARNLPKASNYFFSYLALQGLSVSASALLQTGPLFKWLISLWIDRTPRQILDRKTILPQVSWGSTYPVYSNLACIGLAYSIISPLIVMFSVIVFGLFWFVARYNLLYVSASPYNMGGRLYPIALKQLFIGIYTMELCLIGLFFSIRDSQGASGGIGQAVIMVTAMIATVIYQVLLGKSFARVLRGLPVSIDGRKYSKDQSNRKCTLAGAFSSLIPLLPKFTRWLTTHEVSQDLKDTISEIPQNQLDVLEKSGYQPQDVHCRSPTILIPKDPLGVSKGLIKHAKNVSQGIRISDEFVQVDLKGRLEVIGDIHDIDSM